MKSFGILILLLGTIRIYSQITLPIDFESSTITYSFSDFDGGQMSVENNPDMSATNPSAKVARMIKNAGQPWGGSFLQLDSSIDFSSTRQFKMKVWAPAIGTPVLLKVENRDNASIFFEKQEFTTSANTWEEMTFDFSAINSAQSYHRIIFIFNLGTVGNGSAAFTYYVDDISLVAGSGGLNQVDLPVTFEDTATVDYALVDFGGNNSSIVPDPTNQANLVAQAIKTANAELWAGTTIGGNGLANPVPFSAMDTKISVRVWSPDANTPIRLKVEDAANPAISVETEVSTSAAGVWDTLEFNFSNPVTGTAPLNLSNIYNKVSIFFNFGTTGAMAGEKTYYWDDIQFTPGGGSALAQVDLPISFEDTATVDYALVDFGGNVSAIVTDPTNPANLVGQTIKTANAELWAGTTMGGSGLASPVPFTSANTRMSVRVWSPDADTPIRLKVEDAANPTISVETEVSTSAAGVWDTLEFNFSNPVTGTTPLNLSNTYNKVSIFFNFGTTGAMAGEKIYYWDDVQFVGGGGSGKSQPDLPITFQDTTTVDYALVGFGGNISSIVVDPTDPNNLVGQAIKTANAEPWAGTTMGGSGLANPVPFTAMDTKISVRVWSPDADTPIRLKVEDAANPAISVETEVNTSAAGVWDTLEFDFNNQVDGTAPLNLSNTYNKVSIFFNFGTTGAMAGEKIYYWDDVQFVDGTVNIRDQDALSAGLKMYPNPVSEVLTIELPERLVLPYRLTMFDNGGRFVLSQDLNHPVSWLSVRGLSEGLYYLKLQNDRESFYQKLIINR